MSAWERRTYGTPGYNTIMGEIRMGDFHDPWNLGITWLFALAEVLYVHTGDILPGFDPAPSLRWPADLEGYEQERLTEMLMYGTIGYEDIRQAFTIMSRFDDWCRIAGRDY